MSCDVHETLRYAIIGAIVVAVISLMSSCDKVRWEAKEKTVQACLASDRTAEECTRVR
jgi:hypothetical protein